MRKKETIPVDEVLHRRVEQLARANGTSEAEVVREALEEYFSAREVGASCYDRLERAGVIGCVEDAPADLSTNPEHFEGFGRG